MLNHNVREKYASWSGKEEAVLSYLPLVRKIAGKIAMALPPALDENDLIGSGIIGLLEAWERFEHGRGVGFHQYAALRIKGAMIDELRRLSWTSRSFFPRLRQVQQAEEKLTQELQREPSAAEISGALGWTAGMVEQVWSHYNLLSLLSLERLLFGNMEEEGFRLEEVVPASGKEPGDDLILLERQRELAEALDHLSPREREVLSLYYYEDLTQKEIAQLLEISTARVSQLHARALKRLRGLLRHSGDEEEYGCLQGE